MFGAIEAGGTKFVVAVGHINGPDKPPAIIDRAVIPTREPEETLADVLDFFRRQSEKRQEALAALGVASFGPLDLDPKSPTYGAITTTPKLVWRGFPLKKRLEAALSVPVAIDTDVAGAALAEATYGAAAGERDVVYFTVGTGVGVGVLSGGRIVHGIGHPEFGHLRVRRLPGDDFPGICPYHGDCLEGLASGPAIRARAGRPAEALAPDDPAWAPVADALAEAVAAVVLLLAPAKVILGGGVMKQRHLFPRIREGVRAKLGGYVAYPALMPGPEGLDAYIVPPGLGDDAGLIGAFELARRAVAR
ncbi:MAG: ROK family protein [Hydrogenibacillus schlegelii]|nr:ROK family protein [Hydrogenibacillus schlegelii]